MAIREVLVDARNQVPPFPASTAIAVGDLLWWDNSGKVAKPASTRTDLGSAAANQADFASLFCGVSASQRLATETSTGTPQAARAIIAEGIFDCDCASATFEVGDLVGVNRNATPLNDNQVVVAVTQPQLAIGRVIKREGVAVTKVRCFLSAYLYGGNTAKPMYFDRQLAGTATAMADADTTLTTASSTTQVGIPTAARKVILPAPAQSQGLTFMVVNNSAGAFALNVRDSADTVIIQSIPQNKRAWFWCDGTTWYGLLGA